MVSEEKKKSFPRAESLPRIEFSRSLVLSSRDSASRCRKIPFRPKPTTHDDNIILYLLYYLYDACTIRLLYVYANSSPPPQEVYKKSSQPVTVIIFLSRFILSHLYVNASSHTTMYFSPPNFYCYCFLIIFTCTIRIVYFSKQMSSSVVCI